MSTIFYKKSVIKKYVIKYTMQKRRKAWLNLLSEKILRRFMIKC